TYRTREEVETWKTRCPLAQLRHKLDEGEADAIDAKVAGLVREALEQAEQDPWPDPASAATHVYAEGPLGGLTPPARPGPAREIPFRQATHEALSGEMARNPKVFVLGEGIGQRGGNFRTTAGLYELYGPLRLCDTPISERGFVGLACGAAMTGTRPVA